MSRRGSSVVQSVCRRATCPRVRATAGRNRRVSRTARCSGEQDRRHTECKHSWYLFRTSEHSKEPLPMDHGCFVIGQLTRAVMDIHDFYRPILTHFRTKRMAEFCRLFAVDENTRIVDVGGYEFNWMLVKEAPEVLMINLEDE